MADTSLVHVQSPVAALLRLAVGIVPGELTVSFSASNDVETISANLALTISIVALEAAIHVTRVADAIATKVFSFQTSGWFNAPGFSLIRSPLELKASIALVAQVVGRAVHAAISTRSALIEVNIEE